MARIDVNIIGAGVVSAIGTSLSQHAGDIDMSGIRPVPVPHELFETTLSHPVFTVSSNGLLKKVLSLVEESEAVADVSSLNRTEIFFLTAVADALKCAGISPLRIQQVRVGVAVGTTVGSTFTDHEGYNAWKQGEPVDETGVRSFFLGNLARLLHTVLGTDGPAAVVVNACSSGTDAIGIAAEWLRQGMCEIAIAGGADELSVIPYHGFSSLQLLDDAACRPFDVSRSGLNLGEGAACLLMDTGSFSPSMNILGKVLSYGAASDAWHPTAPHPEGRGLASAISMAVERAGVSLSDISLINAHGTGTVANDYAEASALLSVFGNNIPPVVSTKGATGHTLGAAGAVEAVLTLLALSSGRAHGTPGCLSTDPEIKVPVILQGETRSLSGTIGVSQSLAFGGGNSALVLEATRSGDRENPS